MTGMSNPHAPREPQKIVTLVCVNKTIFRLQDTLFGVLRKIATARSKSVRFSSNFHQMLASACKI